MIISRTGSVGRFAAFGLMTLMALSLTACVSVQKSGNRDVPPPPPEMTSVMFDADRRYAEVYVNGEFRGTAPVNLHLPAGTHVIEFRLQGFQPWKRELVVVAGNDTRVGATLIPE